MALHITPKELIEQQFLKYVGYFPNIDNPRTFNEKIQWLKLYYKDPAMTTCVDKYAVREYVSERIGKEYLIPLIGVYENEEKINFQDLPNGFVLKTTNGSGTNIICKNKNKLNIAETKSKLKEWLKAENSQYFYSYEWAYKNITPRITCETLLKEEDGINDYKFYCFQGIPKFFHISVDRDIDLKVDFYDMDCLHLPVRREYPNNKKAVELPKKFKEMVWIAKKLSKNFPFVRVDLYENGGHIFFGELTFYPSNGVGGFHPSYWDYLFGKFLDIKAIMQKRIDEYLQHKKKRKAEIVVYTAISDTYDRLIQHKYISREFDYVCFTNDDIKNPGIWEIRKLKNKNLDQIRTARYHKLFPNHLFNHEYQYTVWIDANIDVLDDKLEQRINELIKNDELLAVNVHDKRNCIYEEAKECIKTQKDNPQIIEEEVKFLQKEHYPKDNGLFETNIIFRKHSSEKIFNAMNGWWHMICNFSYRDQLSFNYILWKNQEHCTNLFPLNARLMDDFSFKKHNPRIISTLYINQGSGFISSDCIQKKIIILENKFEIQYELNMFPKIKELKFNISKNQFCLLKIDKVTLHNKIKSYKVKPSEIKFNSGATQLSNGFIDFPTSNPEITFPSIENAISVELGGEVRFYNVENRFFEIEQDLDKIKSAKAFKLWRLYHSLLSISKETTQRKTNLSKNEISLKEYGSALQHELDTIQDSKFYHLWQSLAKLKKISH